MESVNSVENAVDIVIEKTAGDIRLGLPLGLGKPNQFVNALYQRVAADSSLSLKIFTALSLGKPSGGSDLEKRFLAPFVDRVFGDYEELDYLQPYKRNALPDNIEVYEFFAQPASILGSTGAQQHYINSNYTHAARDLNARGVNVVAQLLAVRGEGSDTSVSFSCNPEVTLELIPLLQARKDMGEAIVTIGQLHRDLPFMENDALADPWLDEFDVIIDAPNTHTRLFSTPNMPVNLQDHFIGLHASTLVKDGGTLQIGIGALGDAVGHHLTLREKDNAGYESLLNAFALPVAQKTMIVQEGGIQPFKAGLYGCSEMVTHALLSLMDEGVIRRAVYAWPALQSWVNQRGEQPSVEMLAFLAFHEYGQVSLCKPLLEKLLAHGVLTGDVTLTDAGALRIHGDTVANDLDSPETRASLALALGKRLTGGTRLHGGFFLGPQAFYERLRTLNDDERAAINMTAIGYINHLYGGEELKRSQRAHARFINTAFTMTLLGAAVSDQIDDGRVLSGVGGQYNFVSQAHELDDARSILMVRAWRERGGEAMSNIVFSYPHNTIPRHLRDIVITEYGVADLRSRTDEEVVMAMLNIADSRFQVDLMAQAKAAGKLRQDYTIPEQYRANNPAKLEAVAEQCGRALLPSFPLGSDFTPLERELLKALGWLKEKMSQKDYLQLGRQALFHEGDETQFHDALARMGLADPQGVKEHLYHRLLLAALEATTSP